MTVSGRSKVTSAQRTDNSLLSVPSSRPSLIPGPGSGSGSGSGSPYANVTTNGTDPLILSIDASADIIIPSQTLPPNSSFSPSTSPSFSSSAHTPRTSKSSVPSHICKPTDASTSVSVAGVLSPEDALKAERGWIQHTDRTFTHNVCLNEARAVAMAARMVSTTPSDSDVFLSVRV